MNAKTAALAAALATLNVAAVLSQPQDGFAPQFLYYTSAVASGVVPVDPDTGALQPAFITGLPDPEGLLFASDGQLLVSDGDADLLRIVDPGGSEIGSIGAGSGLDDPRGMALGPGGHVFVAGFGNDAVYRYDRGGNLVGIIDASGGNGPLLDAPVDVTFGPEGHLLVSASGADRVHEYDPSGAFLGTLGEGSSLDGPWGLALGRLGRLYVAGHESHRVHVFDPAGQEVASFGAGTSLSAPTDLAFGPDGRLWVASSSDEILVFDPFDGSLLASVDVSAAAGPRGLAFAPFSSSFSLKGSVQAPGGSSAKFKDGGLMSFEPGLGRTTLWLDPGSDAAAVLGDDVLVFHGLPVVDLDGKGAQTLGFEVDGDAREHGLSSLLTEPTAKSKGGDLPGIKKVRGELQATGRDGEVVEAKLKSGN